MTADEDFVIPKDALAGQSAVRFELHDDYNHRFQRGDGPATSAEYYEADAAFARRVVEDTVGFLDRHVRRRPRVEACGRCRGEMVWRGPGIADSR